VIQYNKGENMTVEQLMELLKKENPSDRVVIKAKTHLANTFGAMQSVRIDNIDGGFDWESGMVFIYPDAPMRLVEYKDSDKKRSVK